MVKKIILIVLSVFILLSCSEEMKEENKLIKKRSDEMDNGFVGDRIEIIDTLDIRSGIYVYRIDSVEYIGRLTGRCESRYDFLTKK